jgi:putative serine protease PepD
MSTHAPNRASGSTGGSARSSSSRPFVVQRSRVWLLALIALASALLGGAAVTGVLVAFGAAGETSAPGATGLAASWSPDWPSGIYARTAAGVVAITSSGIVSASGESGVATGTGQIIDSHGDVLTASHVIAGASTVTVKFQNGTVSRARVLGVDRSTDVAVLRVDVRDPAAHPLRLGGAQSLSVGDAVAVIGNPFGYNRSLSTGVVSALDRTIPTPNGFALAHAIQTDAAINPGNSGGPMLNTGGEVVGFVDQIATGGSGADSDTGVGFAIPTDIVKSELSQLERGATVTHAYIGASTAQALEADGALVQEVSAGSPAAIAGLRTDDLVTAIDGGAVRGPSGFVAAIAARRPGETLRLTVRRGSSTLTLTATLATEPREASSG